MKSKHAYGLGWQPDLPDFRDKTFSMAWDKLKKRPGRQKMEKEKKSGQDSAAKHTFEGWENSSAASADLVEKETGDKDAADTRWRKNFDAALARAFDGRAPQKGVLAAAPPATPLPSVDLRPFQSPIEDQEQIGSCTAHAVVGLVEYLQIVTSGRYLDSSRLFLYKATRELLQWEGDTGAYIRETIKALRLFGVCPETHWPYYTARFDEVPSAFCYAFAANYKALRFYRLNNLGEIKRSLSQGYPVAFGFTCFESLFTDRATRTGRIPVPLTSEKSVGGHAVLAVGYNDDPGDNQNPSACPPGHVIIRNSWGRSWGQGGYGFLPYEFFTGAGPRNIPLADDFWTMTKMEVVALDQARTAPFALGEGGNEVFGLVGGNEPFGLRRRDGTLMAAAAGGNEVFGGGGGGGVMLAAADGGGEVFGVKGGPVKVIRAAEGNSTFGGGGGGGVM